MRRNASPDPEAARFRLFDSTATFLRNAAEQRPILLVLEDLHGADRPSLLLLEFVARSVLESSVLILATYRDVAVGRDHPLAPSLVELLRGPGTRRLTLGGLGEGDVRRFVEIASGARPMPGLVRAIHQETEGNPLFVGEIVRLLASEGRLTDRNLTDLRPIPQGIKEVIGRRVGHLSERCNHVLSLASVIGREFGVDVLEQVSERRVDELLEILDEAESARLLSEAQASLGVFRFSHALIRDTLYEELGASRRARLHRRVGEVIERLHGKDPDRLAELAYHFFAASPLGTSAKAVGCARAAARVAESRLAYEEAARLYEMALQATELASPLEEAERLELLMSLGDALTRAGQTEEAKGRFLDAAGIARRLGPAAHLGRAALGHGGPFTWTVMRGDPVLRTLLEEALEALGEEESPPCGETDGEARSGPPAGRRGRRPEG